MFSRLGARLSEAPWKNRESRLFVFMGLTLTKVDLSLGGANICFLYVSLAQMAC